MIGQTINNYVLERKLGEGGMGDVYFARHNRIDRVVAIKVLHKNLFTNENIRTRFKNEANALIKLGHPNIVKIYDYVEQDEFACLIMEYIEGFTLDDYINKVTGPLPAPKATHIICSVLDAVQYAHEKNIFHRDIKPGNIMVSKDGKVVRIMDFSIAKFTDAANLKTTHANAQLGTPFYMSPEQVKGMVFTALSDIYSLGVTLFEMVTGKCPYQEITNLFELQSKIVNEPLPPTGKYYPNVTGKLQDAIIIATNKAPEQRFKSCTEFKAFLMEEEKVRPVIVPIPIPLKKSQIRKPLPAAAMPEPANLPAFFEEKKKSKAWVYLLGLLAILIIGIVAFKELNKPGDKGGGTGTVDSAKVNVSIDTTNSFSVDTTNTVGVPDVGTEPTSIKDSNYSPPPPPPPSPDRIINDLVGKKLSCGLTFSESDKANIRRRPVFNSAHNNATLEFIDPNSDAVHRATIFYGKNGAGYYYLTNACKKNEPTNQCPSESKIRNDLLSHKQDLCIPYTSGDAIRNRSCTFSEDGEECNTNFILRKKDGLEYNVSLDYKNISFELIGIPVCEMITKVKPPLPQSQPTDSSKKKGGNQPLPKPPSLPALQRVKDDFWKYISKSGITSSVSYTGNSKITELNINMTPNYYSNKKYVSFLIKFKVEGVNCSSKIVYYDNGQEYTYNTINPQQ